MRNFEVQNFAAQAKIPIAIGMRQQEQFISRIYTSPKSGLGTVIQFEDFDATQWLKLRFK